MEHWNGVKKTKEFGPRPVQPMVYGDMKARSAGVSEDCLYLNIWTPALRNTKDLPVLVYFYGGGNVAGDTPEMPKPVGAAHASEIEYCMGNLHLVDTCGWTEDDYKVSETMHNFFANFIKTGNPNGAEVPNWPATEPNDTEPSIMIIDTKSGAKKALNDARYVFLDKAYKN